MRRLLRGQVQSRGEKCTNEEEWSYQTSFLPPVASAYSKQAQLCRRGGILANGHRSS
ncbi:MAG TPA: hypothetical protein VJS11_08585 [Acidobacteriaceae bacterium]|nr:hypothetical protein [Acidobacteriaceae bacterium]